MYFNRYRLQKFALDSQSNYLIISDNMLGRERPLPALRNLRSPDQVWNYCERHGFTIHDDIMFDAQGRFRARGDAGDPVTSTLYLLGDSVVVQWINHANFNLIQGVLTGNREQQSRMYWELHPNLMSAQRSRRQAERDGWALQQLGGQGMAAFLGHMMGHLDNRLDTIEAKIDNVTAMVDRMRRQQRKFEEFVAMALQHLDNRITEMEEQQAAIGMMLLEAICGVAEEVHNQESVDFVQQLEGLSSYTNQDGETIASQIGHTVTMRYHGGRPDGALCRDITKQILDAPIQLKTSASMPASRGRRR